MKVELMKANTADDFAAIRNKVMNGEFASVSENECNPFLLCCLLFYSRCDCDCHIENGIAVFGKLTTDQIYRFRLELGRLISNKLCAMQHDYVERFVQYANAFGYNVMGGAISDDCKSQYLYID